MNPHDKGWTESNKVLDRSLPGPAIAISLAIGMVAGFTGLLVLAGYLGEAISWVVSLL